MERQRSLPFSYPEVGATLGEAPAGYTVDRTRLRLGEGADAFEIAARALSKWRHCETGWTRLLSAETPVSEGVVVCIVARRLGYYSLSPARIIRVLDETSRYPGYCRCGFVYGTLTTHT